MARYSYHFRASAGAWAEANPHTYVLNTDAYPTTRNGLTFGRAATISSANDSSASGSARISGSIAATSAGQTVRIDLNDGPGTYRLYLGIGRITGSSTPGCRVLRASDDSELHIVPQTSVAANQVMDATGAVMSVAAWLQSNVSATGTAQAGAIATITLAAGASAVNGFYVGKTVLLTSGTGSGQYKEITAYDGASRQATVRSAWTTAPDATSGYSICDGGGGYFEFTTTETALKFQRPSSRMDLACIELEYVVTPLVNAVISEENGTGTLSTLYAKEPQGKKIGRIYSTIGAQNFSVVGPAATWLTTAQIDGEAWMVATGTPMPDNLPALLSSITIRQTTTAETRDTVIPLPTFVTAPTKPTTGRLALLTTRTWLRRERIRAVTQVNNWAGYQGQAIAPARDFAAATPAEFKAAYQAITPDGVSWYRIRLQGSTMWTGIQDVSGYKDFGAGGLLVEPDAGHDPIIAAQWDNLVGRGIHWRNSILVPLGNYCFNGTLASTASSYARILIEGNRIGHMFVPGELASNFDNWNTFLLYRFYEEITIRNNTVWGLNFLALASGGRITAIRDNDFVMWPVADLLRTSRGVPLQVPRGVFADDESWVDMSGNRLINNPDTFTGKYGTNPPPGAQSINHGDKLQVGRAGDGYLYPYSAYPNGNTGSSWTISPQTRCLNKVEKKIYKVVARAANGGYAAGVAVGGQGNPGPSGGAAAGDIVDGGVTWRYETDYYHEGPFNILMENEFANDDGMSYSADTALSNIIAPSHQLMIASNVGMLCPIEAVVINCIYANGAGRGIDAGGDGVAHVELTSLVGPAERPIVQGVAVTLSNQYIDAGTVRAFNNVLSYSPTVSTPGGLNLNGGGSGGFAHQGNLIVDFTSGTANGRRPTDLLTGPFTQRSDGSYGFALVEDGTNPIDVVISDLAKIMHPLSGNAGGRATEYHPITIQDSAGASATRTLTITP
ncbi:hypothetical protein OOT33_13725 [Sphingobium sp. DEHP117]|uniref:hypothetical protein n=1 Tax=Sphingobium sp. DEHP117 TaxID=2993436 RepID=UPI0027D682A7|nr:hypothetical protein [Sphingobium sp. DEHP117]MDQ4421482.1 hypothetical protein [Sphingobium sp. DEHP117]